MNSRLHRFVFCVLLLPCILCAQRGQRNSQGPGTVLHVRVVNDHERAVTMNLRVELLPASSETTLTETMTNSEGVAELQLQLQGGGNFRLRVSGAGVETTTSDTFPMDPEEGSHLEFVKVKLTSTDEASTQAPGGVIGAKQYNIPKDATKEFDAGVASLHASDWKKAQSHFEAAIVKYPSFDQAYDDLGIARQNSGDLAGAKTAYQKAIEINDHNANAERDLARVLEGERKWPEAEDLLNKSLAMEPNNAGSLTLLSVAQIEQGKLNDAINTAGRVHALEHSSYAMAHFVLARAYELKQQNRDAIVEYQTYLKEAPNGPQADFAKKRLVKLMQAPAS